MKRKNPADLTGRNLRAAKKRELSLLDLILNRAGTLDHRVTNLSDLLDGVIRRVARLEKASK
jgi:hypothetical protein